MSGIAICTPIPGINNRNNPEGGRLAPITVEWHRSRLEIQLPSNTAAGEIFVDGYPVDEARNEAVRECLESPREPSFLFFWDYDVLIPPRGLIRLLYQMRQHPDCEIVSGVYCMKNEPSEPLIYKEFGDGAFWDWRVGDILIDGIQSIGMGCALINVTLLRRLHRLDPTKPLFKTGACQLGPLPVEHNRTSEDLYFCQRAIREAGAKILVDTGLQCGHIDNETGRVYSLPEDSLPMQRMREDKEREAMANAVCAN